MWIIAQSSSDITQPICLGSDQYERNSVKKTCKKIWLRLTLVTPSKRCLGRTPHSPENCLQTCYLLSFLLKVKKTWNNFNIVTFVIVLCYNICEKTFEVSYSEFSICCMLYYESATHLEVSNFIMKRVSVKVLEVTEIWKSLDPHFMGWEILSILNRCQWGWFF